MNSSVVVGCISAALLRLQKANLCFNFPPAG